MLRSFESVRLRRPCISLLNVVKIVPVLLGERRVFCSQRHKRAAIGGDDVQSLGGSEVEMYAPRYTQS